MGLPRSIRFEPELEEQLEKYLETNNLKFVQLVNMAVTKFINEEHTIILEPIDKKTAIQKAKNFYSKHKKAMDKLK